MGGPECVFGCVAVISACVFLCRLIDAAAAESIKVPAPENATDSKPLSEDEDYWREV